jgi:hypothetical protein
MNNLTSDTVLRLNGNYQRLVFCNVQEAFTALMGESKDGSPPALSLDVIYDYNEFGKPILDYIQSFVPFSWEEWLEIDGRRGNLDTFINTTKRIIRVPTILICPKFRKMPMRQEHVTPSTIRERDGNRCQYTGVPLTNKTFSLDHIHPKSKGGKDDWYNLVSCHKSVNFKKGDQENEKIGLTLLKPIRPPRIQPICNLVKGEFHIDHHWF